MIVSGTILKHANDVKERMQSLFEEVSTYTFRSNLPNYG